MSRVRNNLSKLQRIVADVSETKTITTESDALGTGVANWISVLSWRSNESGFQPGRATATPRYIESFPKFELEIDCDAAEVLLASKLYACRLAPIVIADDTFTASGATITAASHGLLDGDGPLYVSSTTTLPPGLEEDVAYFVQVIDANTFSFHTTRPGAIAQSSATKITTTGAGSGTHTLADLQTAVNADDNTKRYRFTLVGDLNEAADITVGVQLSYMERIEHSPLNEYYILFATETNTETIVVRLTPVVPFEE